MTTMNLALLTAGSTALLAFWALLLAAAALWLGAS